MRTETGGRPGSRVGEAEARHRSGPGELLRGGAIGIALMTAATAGLIAGAALIAAVVTALS